MPYPAAIPALALAAGITAGIFLPGFFVLPQTSFLLCLLGAAVAFTCRAERATTVFLGLGFALAGFLMGAHANRTALTTPLGILFDQRLPADEHQLFVVVEGRLRTDAARSPSGVNLSIEVDEIELNGTSRPTSGGIIVGVGGELSTNQISTWRSGRRVRLPATVRRPAKYLNPGASDSERQFAWRGITLVGSTKSDRLIEIVAYGDVCSEASGVARAAVRDAVAASVAHWSQRSAAVVSAILIGDRAGLDDQVERRLQEAGTYHVMAISGGNIAILAGLCLLVLRVLRIRGRLAAVIMIVLLSAYAMVVEGGSSVGRATLMAAIYFVAQIWDHRTLPANVAALSAVILFCLDPLEVVDAGFALTFGATLGIVIGTPLLFSALPKARYPNRLPTAPNPRRGGPGGGAAFGSPARAIPHWPEPAIALLAASICAEIALLPVSAFVFSRVTGAGLMLNFAAIPLMTVVQIAGMAAVALTQFGISEAVWAGWIAHWAVEGLIGSASLVDIVPWLTRRVPPPSPFLVALYYGALVMTVVPTFPPSRSFGEVSPKFARSARTAAERSARRARVSASVVVVCGAWMVTAPVFSFGRSTHSLRALRVTFLDVGQGDAAIVQFPDGRSLSIDAGGLPGSTFDIGGRVVSPTFWAVGVRRLDYMSISHGDVDHIGGAAGVFRDFRPFEVWEGVPVPPHAPTRQLRQLADEAGAAWRTLQPADRVRFGEVELVVHHPPHPDWERQRVRNDDSEVIEITYAGVSFVFAGDIGREVERSIASSFEGFPIRILKVPHHGSATSSSREFLEALHPDIAVISAGRGNPFGHPVAGVLDRYRDIGAAIYRTDQDGAVRIETDGNIVRVRTHTNRRLTLRTHGR